MMAASWVLLRWHVYDFTPNPSFANWSLLGPGITTQQLLGPVPAEALSAVGGAEARDEQVCDAGHTWGGA
jgi:hypothetical protein